MKASELNLSVGQRVRFTGYKVSTYDYPKGVKIGDKATITSVRQKGQFGFDYWAKIPGLGEVGFDRSELEALP